MDRGKYKNGFAWYDSENPEGFGGYKLGHHQVVDGTMQTNWRGTAAAMAALFGARGGVNLPDADRQAVYNHLAKHYKEFDKEVPAFKSLQDKQMDKQKFLHQFEGKILGKSDISIGKIVEYKRMDFGGNEIDLYPGNHYFVGKIIDIMTSGTILMYSDAMNATPEDPIITLQDHIVINGQLVMTGNYCVDRFSSLWIEKEYSASKSYVAMYMKDAEDNIHSSGEEDDKEGEIENQEPEGGDTPPEG
jgi:sugar (pentulose or hexulose) kinase